MQEYFGQYSECKRYKAKCMELSDDLQIFNRLISDYQARFIRFANTYVRNLTVAEDFTMEALMYYWENRTSLGDNTNPPAYILTIIKHKCLNYLQHQQTHFDTTEQLMEHARWELSTRISTLRACEPDGLFTAEIQAIVNKTLSTLPEQTRRIFVMNRYQNMTQKKIAEALHITPKGVEFHMNKALKALRVALKDYMPAILPFL